MTTLFCSTWDLKNHFQHSNVAASCVHFPKPSPPMIRDTNMHRRVLRTHISHSVMLQNLLISICVNSTSVGKLKEKFGHPEVGFCVKMINGWCDKGGHVMQDRCGFTGLLKGAV